MTVTTLESKHLCLAVEKLFVCEKCKSRTERIESRLSFSGKVSWVCTSCAEKLKSGNKNSERCVER